MKSHFSPFGSFKEARLCFFGMESMGERMPEVEVKQEKKESVDVSSEVINSPEAAVDKAHKELSRVRIDLAELKLDVDGSTDFATRAEKEAQEPMNFDFDGASKIG